MLLVTDGPSPACIFLGYINMNTEGFWGGRGAKYPDGSCERIEMYRLTGVVLTWCSRNSVIRQEEGAREFVRSPEPRARGAAFLHGFCCL